VLLAQIDGFLIVVAISLTLLGVSVDRLTAPYAEFNARARKIRAWAFGLSAVAWAAVAIFNVLALLVAIANFFLTFLK
jgi:hypothetical protein